MLSLQGDPRQYHLQQVAQEQQQQQQPQQNQQLISRILFDVSGLAGGDQRVDSSSSALSSTASTNINPDVAREIDEDMLLTLAHQNYKAGNYNQALENCKAVYEKNPRRTDNLLLFGAIYYQLHDFDMCIAKNEEAIRVNPHFAECYGNMANAWKEKGNIDVAIRYYLVAIEFRPNFADVWSNLASAYMRKGRLTEAAQCCRQALALNPSLVDAHSNLGNLMKTQGLVQEAYTCYVEALRIQPTFAIAWSNLAGLFMEAGDLNRAVQYYKEAVKLKPNFPDAYLNLGNVYKALAMPQEAIMCYQRALQVRPDYAMAFGNLASLYYEQGNLDMAILNYRRAISCDAGFLEAYNNLGNALKDSGRVEEAIHCYRQCLSLQPNHPQALTNLGNIYMDWNLVSAAAQCYKATLVVTTGLSAPFNNLAIIYKQQGSYADAISCYNEVLRIDPLAADGHVNRGNTYKEIGRVNEAIQDYLRAITIKPSMAEAHANLASAYKDSGNVEVAIKSYRQALILRPDFPEATCNLLHTLQCVCDWDNREQMFIEVEEILQRQIKMSVLPSVQPFHAIAYPLDPMLALDISRKYAQHCSVIASRYSLPSFNHPPSLPIKGGSGNVRLRVGYVSSDFGNHPLSHLMGSVFGMHDKENVEVFCYALSPNDGTEWRLRIHSEAEHFKDVSSMSSDMIARMINEDQIQILINLNGYTKGARNEIFAMQPAPIQVSYMGFPGTTGATYIHYLVTDEFVSPTRYSHIYSEKLVHLPHCYFVNDYKQKNCDVLDPDCLPKRSDYGLPEDKFIFACFNQLYKMDPEICTTWCNILKRVPNSALWLLRFPAAGELRLRAYAAAQGVQPDQIIFTDVAMKQEHIRRSSLADLFLDTPLCNAHTTGTDVLWAGLPMVTLPLEKMATRVAGSLCLATGLGDEMIVNNMKEYEEKAVSLALDRPKLQDLTNRLKAARITCPLFDTERWVRNLERAYFKMWNLYCSGQHPLPFKVIENDKEFPYDR
ncbi:PREDICTED: probable UDP-N-acetylglucosamine--peptide N-acetylglucosaminyltransferase SEC [Ipomoea nil]|uniref:probable UDP-N-acetylglucosamine--peptide N-acetylglucosaminyltransferase SEC n=1 Tax=Ipomoea nil TaxID=35883 RepID=UPI000900B961|nr:PREDICTED: probable UDP-N-acetylglucosamine--peptide N-acetylglucosaminyltransferase SEC [Ipomoea nil]XP_019179994.1 PREDICTED: probable UDP-N-acetylglucosamine--peptide N-acetylglucosaminyltransferase SEC [Ipomoea nil]